MTKLINWLVRHEYVLIIWSVLVGIEATSMVANLVFQYSFPIFVVQMPVTMMLLIATALMTTSVKARQADIRRATPVCRHQEFYVWKECQDCGITIPVYRESDYL